MKILAVIPARGGSKGLPGKNLRPLAGRPLLAWTIEAASQARTVDRVILTSDDPAIMETARAWGCEVPFQRPAELAEDTTPTQAALHHAMDMMAGGDFSHVLVLQPTSPLRTAADIDAAAEVLQAAQAPACVSVCRLDKPLEWLYTQDATGRLRPACPGPAPVSRRQDGTPVCTPNGALYLARWAWIRARDDFFGPDVIGYPMSAERSLDIDTLADLERAEALMAQAGVPAPPPRAPEGLA
ncbi:cytidylyltransferase domain-containing protein [Roseospirillum parvum]|nr:acylneuraminate cytidylyltransferase family protein [Roseospirillum parvum]